MRRSVLLVLALVFFLGVSGYTPALLAQEKKEKGKLGDFEDDVDKGDDSEGFSDGGGEVSFFFFLENLDLLRFVPQALVTGFPYEDSLLYGGRYWQSTFSDYPYAPGQAGLFLPGAGKRFSLHFSGHFFRESSRLQGLGLRARWSPNPYLALIAHYTDLTEELTTRNDHLRLYDLLVNYYRVRQPHWTLWWGLGLKGFQGDFTHNGFAFNLGTEFYPFAPLSVQVNYSYGFVGASGVQEWYLRLGWHIKRHILFLGYQQFSAGSTVIDGVVLGVGVYL